MKSQNHHRLLREIISGKDHEQFRQASLEAGLGALRRRRRTRTGMRFGIAVACGCLLANSFRIRQTRVAHPSSPVTLASTVLKPQPKPEPVKIISDEELFALFPGRAVALVGPRGRQQFVFLDQPAAKKGVWH
jgi:hypothetical protein